MRTNFKEIKEDVLKYYEEVVDTANRCGFPQDDTTLKGLIAQSKKVKEDKFCLLVAGEAKSGKSTFINAYLGTEILPMPVLYGVISFDGITNLVIGVYSENDADACSVKSIMQGLLDGVELTPFYPGYATREASHCSLIWK